MARPAPDIIAVLTARLADDTAQIRECLRTRGWEAALDAARRRQADLEALGAAGQAAPPQRTRALLERALHETWALTPEIARLRESAAAQLQQTGRRARASAAYRGLAPR